MSPDEGQFSCTNKFIRTNKFFYKILKYRMLLHIALKKELLKKLLKFYKKKLLSLNFDLL